MGALSANNAVTNIYCGFAVFYAYRPHRTLVGADTAANATGLINLHFKGSRQAAARRVKGGAHSAHRAQQITVTATALSK